MNIKPPQHGFKFANAKYSSPGSVQLPLHTPPGVRTIIVHSEIVCADVPALLGLYVLDSNHLSSDTTFNLLAKRTRLINDDGTVVYIDKWSVPLFRGSRKHVYACIGNKTAVDILFTRSKLVRLHLHFFHPSAEKLFNILRRARPDEATPQTKAILQDITKRCNPCQRIQNAPHSFRVSFGTPEARFNERIMVDLMTIDGQKILHVVDEGTRFSVAQLLEDESNETIWNTLIKCWLTIYTGLPNRILVDQGRNLGPLFVHMSHLRRVAVEHNGD